MNLKPALHPRVPIRRRKSCWRLQSARLLSEHGEGPQGVIVKRLSAIVLLGISCIFTGASAGAQSIVQQESSSRPISTQDLDLLRQDLRSKRKQLIAANLKLTETEAAKFWPVYDQYIKELIGINDKKFALIQD